MNDRNRRDFDELQGEIDKAFLTLKSMGKPKEWITGTNSKKLINEVCDPMGRGFSRSVNTSQIRKFLDEVRRIDMEFGIEKVPFLQAKLAYAAGRNNQLKQFHNIVSYALQNIEDEKDFQGFKELILGIIAYHKYHGGN